MVDLVARNPVAVRYSIPPLGSQRRMWRAYLQWRPVRRKSVCGRDGAPKHGTRVHCAVRRFAVAARDPPPPVVVPKSFDLSPYEHSSLRVPPLVVIFPHMYSRLTSIIPFPRQSFFHVDCFKCAKCGNQVTADTNLLLLSDGSPICANCSYSCNVCKLPILDEAIMTGEDSYHAHCFKCKVCKNRIDELVFAKTSQGIYCMNCHNERVARSRRHQARKQEREREKERERERAAAAQQQLQQQQQQPAQQQPQPQQQQQQQEADPRGGSNGRQGDERESQNGRPAYAVRRSSVYMHVFEVSCGLRSGYVCLG